MQVLILTFKASMTGLGLFLVALIVCLLVYSSAIYYAELGIQGSQIHSIPDAFWWAIITMTTVVAMTTEKNIENNTFAAALL